MQDAGILPGNRRISRQTALRELAPDPCGRRGGATESSGNPGNPAKKRRHEDVVVFLQEHGQGVVPRTHAATPTLPQPFIRCWRQHGPRNRTSPNKYKLFYAAMDGCLECVTRLVLREGVPTDVVSDTHKYAVSDYVEWGATHGRKGSHDDVRSFLREQAGLAFGSSVQ